MGTNINLGTLGTISWDMGPFFSGHWAIFENVRKFYWNKSIIMHNGWKED